MVREISNTKAIYSGQFEEVNFGTEKEIVSETQIIASENILQAISED